MSFGSRSRTTIADGLGVTAPGVATFAINRELVSDVVTVSDDELVNAMVVAFDLFDRRFEPSAVAGLAAILGDPSRFRGRRVAVVLTGGNIDEGRFNALTGGSG